MNGVCLVKKYNDCAKNWIKPIKRFQTLRNYLETKYWYSRSSQASSTGFYQDWLTSFIKPDPQKIVNRLCDYQKVLSVWTKLFPFSSQQIFHLIMELFSTEHNSFLGWSKKPWNHSFIEIHWKMLFWRVLIILDVKWLFVVLSS